jgi:ABC-type antimicrobial peptide transport system permease subunit
VVGVVGNVLDDGFAAEPEPLFYRTFGQRPVRSRFFMLETRGEPRELAPRVRAAVREMDQVTPVTGFRSMEELLASSVAGQRAASGFSAALGVLALILAVVGIYGVLSYMVAGRTREMGIRTALGARSGDVVGLVLRSSLAVAGLGVLGGSVAALALSRVLASALFGVKPWDPVTFVGTAALLMAAAAAASWLPARRAASVDPVVALRTD